MALPPSPLSRTDAEFLQRLEGAVTLDDEAEEFWQRLDGIENRVKKGGRP